MPVLSFESFIVLALTLRCLGHSELIFVYSVRRPPVVFSCPVSLSPVVWDHWRRPKGALLLLLELTCSLLESRAHVSLPTSFHSRNSSRNPREIRLSVCSSLLCLSHAALSQGPASCFLRPHSLWSQPARGPRIQTSHLCLHRVWKETGSLASNSVLCCLADLIQLHNSIWVTL